MKKILASFLVLMLVLIAACGQKSASNIQEPFKGTTVDSAADSFGNSVNAVNSDENDTSATQLNGVDQGLADIQDI